MQKRDIKEVLNLERALHISMKAAKKGMKHYKELKEECKYNKIYYKDKI